MITEYEIHFALPDIGPVPDTFSDLLNFLEEHNLVEHLLKVEESSSYDLSKPYITLNRKVLFKLSDQKETKNDF